MGINSWFDMIDSMRFHWISSIKGNPAILAELQHRLVTFYSSPAERSSYQEYIDYSTAGSNNSEKSVRALMAKYVYDLNPNLVLEIGCGNGDEYRRLRARGYTNGYCGLDLEYQLIEKNKAAYPDAQFATGSAYQISYPDNYFDVCYALYVLEHFVYPEKALCEMLRVVRSGGAYHFGFS